MNSEKSIVDFEHAEGRESNVGHADDSDLVSVLVASGWHVAVLTWWLGWTLLALTFPYPMVLPGGAIVSPSSWLSLFCSLALIVPCGILARTLVGRVPAPLAVAACASVPAGVIITGLLWCVPACAAIFVAALVVGALAIVIPRHTGGVGVLVHLCAVACVTSVGLVVTLAVGGQLCLRYSEAELVDVARDMLDENSNTSMLYTRWLDGMLWLRVHGY